MLEVSLRFFLETSYVDPDAEHVSRISVNVNSQSEFDVGRGVVVNSGGVNGVQNGRIVSEGGM